MAFDQKPRDFPLVMLVLDELNVATPPANPRNGYRVLVASSGLVGIFQTHENQIATWNVNTWVFTPVANLPGQVFCFFNAGTSKWEYFLHNGTNLLEFATEAYVDDTAATKLDASKLDTELADGQLAVWDAGAGRMAGIERPPGNDIAHKLKGTRTSTSDLTSYTWVPDP